VFLDRHLFVISIPAIVRFGAGIFVKVLKVTLEFIQMGVSYGLVIAGYTVISFCGIAWRISWALNKILLDGTTAEEGIGSVQAGLILQLLLESSLTVALLTNLAINIFILITLFTKAVFLGSLS